VSAHEALDDIEPEPHRIDVPGGKTKVHWGQVLGAQGASGKG
jgi:hypothetical protein